jgi:hypothetical protein
MTTSLRLQPISRKCVMLTHNPSHYTTFLDVSVLRLTGHYNSVSGFDIVTVDVSLEP